MKYRQVCLPILLLVASRIMHAQAVPATIAEAESEGAGYLRAGVGLPTQPFFATQFDGTSDRRCVTSTSENPRGGSLRSGEIIVRGRLVGPNGLRAGRAHKILWLPLHGTSALRSTPLVLRARSLSHPSDSVRLSVTALARGGGASSPLYGYPSSVSFPSPGQWLLVATVGADWGCFVFAVEARDNSTSSLFSP
jgi:hypothetical protein